MTDAVLFSSGSTEWRTPDDLYQRYNERWQFTLDAAATHENYKAPMYCTAEGTYVAAEVQLAREGDGEIRPHEPPQHHSADGLTFGWHTAAPLAMAPRARIWVNPPYGRGDQGAGPWVAKMRREAEVYGALVVGLLPARTDTKWFHDDVIGKAKIEFLRGRVHFERTYDCCEHDAKVHDLRAPALCNDCIAYTDTHEHRYHRAGDSDPAPFPSLVATWGA